MPRECGLCHQPIPPMSKLAQRLTGVSPQRILEQLPTLSRESTLPLKTDEKSGELYIEVCMSCWIHTGEANRR
jgi:hypothetical protein